MSQHVGMFAPVAPPEVLEEKARALREARPSSGDPFLITIAETADLVGVGRGQLARWRCAGEGPSYYKIGGGVLYDLATVLQFIERRREWLCRMAEEARRL